MPPPVSPAQPQGDPPLPSRVTRALSVFRYTGAAARLAWETSRPLTLTYAVLSLVGGLLPPAQAWVAQQIIDTILAASRSGLDAERWEALRWVALEAGLVLLTAAAQRGLDVCSSVLRQLLGHRVNLLILDKALTLSLADFEDDRVYDMMQRARRDATNRPLSLVRRAFALVQNGVSLVTYAAMIFALAPLAVLVIAGAALPTFFAETRFSGEAFRLSRWFSPETRKQAYLAVLVSREDFVKEVKLYGLGPTMVGRYRAIFQSIYAEDRNLALRRALWGFLLGVVGTAALYGAYLWVAMRTVAGALSLGQMAMYLAVFKQGQSAISATLSGIGGMYEDNLYLSNLYEFLDHPAPPDTGTASDGPNPNDGLRFVDVTFTYPGAETPALRHLSLHLRPGQRIALVGHNGSGKTTLVKLMTRLYTPDSGMITLDGRDLNEWSTDALRQRIGVIFQDFVRYQLVVGENIGVGDVRHLEDPSRWQVAAEKGMAHDFVETLPEGYQTQLGRWFKDGRELSGGQWQKVALSRAFMRQDADLLVLDEPTAAMDAEAEAEIFGRLAALSEGQMALLISHRFSTVRMADYILVLDEGTVVESGDHASLLAADGLYARLFTLQAQGYR